MSFCFFKFYGLKLNYVVIQNDEESQNFVFVCCALELIWIILLVY